MPNTTGPRHLLRQQLLLFCFFHAAAFFLKQFPRLSVFLKHFPQLAVFLKFFNHPFFFKSGHRDCTAIAAL